MELAAPNRTLSQIHRGWIYVPAVLLVLNLVDQIFTLIWVQLGHAEEANFMMREVLDRGPVIFALAKTALVAGGAYVLVRLRRHPLARVGLSCGAVVYVGVVLYHLGFLATLMR